MRFAKRLLMVAGAVSLAGLLSAMIAPKAVHAVVATLVQVTNTPSNPVNTAAADAATAFVEQGNCSAFLSNECIANMYTVAAGQTAVIDSISGVCETDPGTAVAEFKLQYMSPSGSLTFFSVPGVALPYGSNAITVAGQNLKTYASAGTIFITGLVNGIPTLPSDFCRFTLSGHIAP